MRSFPNSVTKTDIQDPKAVPVAVAMEAMVTGVISSSVANKVAITEVQVVHNLTDVAMVDSKAMVEEAAMVQEDQAIVAPAATDEGPLMPIPTATALTATGTSAPVPAAAATRGDLTLLSLRYRISLVKVPKKSPFQTFGVAERVEPVAAVAR